MIFNNFCGFQKNKKKLGGGGGGGGGCGYEDFADIFMRSSQNWTSFRCHF